MSEDPPVEGEGAEGSRDNGKRFPVVAIGASAGGLEALSAFFDAMPAQPGLAVVVVHHADEARESHLPELLQRHTGMTVVAAHDGTQLEPNKVFVVHGGLHIELADNHLTEHDVPPKRGSRDVIDFFLRSAAEERGERAIGVVLSGAGSDGSQGIRAIRVAGGLTIAQDPEEAKYGTMPTMAVRTGFVDRVLPVAQMPQAILDYISRSFTVERPEPAETGEHSSSETVEAIIDLLAREYNSDFRFYKRSTIERRIQRRIGLTGADNLVAYRDLLMRDPNEAHQLSRDMLIGVTSFFRDPEAFEDLRELVLRPLVESKGRDEAIRIWVPGAATGEEAYTIAMLVREVQREANKGQPVKVFATDIDPEAMQYAREGVYPESIAADVPDAYLERFFEKLDHSYRVRSEVREDVIFAVHNLLSDPPFTHLDLVSCRNVLIYLQPQAQDSAFEVFAFALDPGGHLFLGKSDGAIGQGDLFARVDSESRILRRTTRVNHGARLPMTAQLSYLGRAARRAHSPSADLTRLNQDVLLAHFDAAVVLTNEAAEIVHFFGPTSRYLRHPTGIANLSLFDMAPEPLGTRLRAAMRAALEDQQTMRLQKVRIDKDGASVLADITVTAARRHDNEPPLIAFIFEEAADARAERLAESDDVSARSRVRELESDLQTTRMDLQATVRELERTNEDLVAANEEIMSMNEELQSANEELETSKEELQSVNEELTTVNQQLSEKVSQLSDTNADLENLFRSAEVAVVFVTADLQVKRFSPAVTRLLNLISTDVGRPLSHVAHNLRDFDLTAAVEQVAETGERLEREAQDQDGNWFILRIHPYQSATNQPEGIVLTFSDVTRLKRAEQSLQFARDYAEGIVAAVPLPLVLIDQDLNLLSANDAFRTMLGVAEDDLAGRSFFAVGGGRWDFSEMHALLESIGPQAPDMRHQELVHDFGDGQVRTVHVSAYYMEPLADELPRVLLAIEDVTERRRTEEEIREQQAVAERRAEKLRELASQVTAAEQVERQRVAALLHDDLQQTLGAAKTRVAGAGNAAQSAEAIDLLDEAIEMTRTLARHLSPPVLHDAGLIAALRWLGSEMQRMHGLRVEVVNATKSEPGSETLAFFLFEATRELLYNVVKHARTDRATVRITRTEERMTIVVNDEGCGFESAELTGGSEMGLGLFSMGQRLELLDGGLDIVTKPGDGCEATIWLPTEVYDRPGPALQRLSRPAGVGQEADAGRPLRVLLVDDHPVVREGLATMLGSIEDVEIIGQASDGEEAVSMALGLRPDVILMDIGMKPMNGIEATRLIKAQLPDTRIIGLSVHEEGQLSQAMLDAGAAGYLTKGAPLQELLAAIRGGHTQAWGGSGDDGGQPAEA